MSDPKPQRVWFITGASTGFGRLLAEQVLAAGDIAVATARKPEQLAELARQYPDTALVLPLDVTSQSAVDAAASSTLDKFGRIDVLVNNAGFGLTGAIEEATEADFMPVVETNVFGLLRVTRAFLPQFRKQRSGHILNLSSIAGVVSSPGMGYYNLSKAAVEGLSEALAGELKPLGIHVTIIEPGPFRTDFLGRSGQHAAQRIPDYDSTAANARKYFEEQDGKQLGDPAKAAAAMIAVVEAANPPLRLLLGASAYHRLQAKFTSWQQEIEDWKSTTLGADFPSPEAK